MKALSKAILEIKDFSKIYKGGIKAVDSINLSVEPGDIFAFIGHNGAGKTTTIRSAVGILDFEGGDIFIDGKSIIKAMARKSVIALYSRQSLISMSILTALAI